MIYNFFDKRIMPAITIEDSSKAVQIAQAVIDGGLDVMEIPFRTSEAAKSIKLIRQAFPEIKIGAGTILTPKQIVEAKEAGAQFALAPGFNPDIVTEADKNGLPFIPGVMTPTELEFCLEMGCTVQKLFPAAQAGGIGMLKALYGPYAHTGVKFIPMGGVSLANMKEYIDQPNVIAVGGSWLATKALIANNDFETIKENVKQAIQQSI